ncbi:dihydrolipoamide acetyltransferase family protein [Advenella kashmirensis]
MTTFNDLLMPKLGLTMTEGMLVEWSVSPGDQVRMGASLFVVETDKVATEIEAPADGVMGDIIVQAGETVPVGTVVARWTGPGQGIDASAEASPQGMSNPQAKPGVPDQAHDTTAPGTKTESDDGIGSITDGGPRIVATPLARRMANEMGLSLTSVTGTGPKGRIKAGDVRAIQNTRLSNEGTPDEARTQASEAAAVQQIKPSALMQSMATRMVQAKQVPHFYLSVEAEVSQLLALRRRLNQHSTSLKLTLNHFVIAAVARALQMCPDQNRIWRDDGILKLNGIDVGIAVATERGLTAPVLHGLGGATLDDIAAQANALIERTRIGKAVRADMEGGAISISNAGMYNVTYMTPIINPPQSAILGVGSIREVFRPDEDGAPALKREMGMVLAADHRLHDGASALEFLNCVVDLLQDPYQLLRTQSNNKG